MEPLNPEKVTSFFAFEIARLIYPQVGHGVIIDRMAGRLRREMPVFLALQKSLNDNEIEKEKPNELNKNGHDFHEDTYFDKGLCHCKICGGAESSLPTYCPGKRMNEICQSQVTAGYIDFLRGRWFIALETNPSPLFEPADRQSPNPDLSQSGPAAACTQSLPPET